MKIKLFGISVTAKWWCRGRGTTKIAADFALLAATVNLKRLAVLHVASVSGSGWVRATG